MKLSALVRDLPGARVSGDTDVEITGVCADSRAVTVGDIFVAVRGRSVDGHDFIGQAIQRGASAIVVERAIEATVPVVIVDASAVALGILASLVAGSPALELAMVGITGTNGKTTTTYVIESIIAATGSRPGVVGTVNYRYGGDTFPAPYTTPTPEVLHNVLRNIVDANSTHAILEVSSAALEMDRLSGIRFQVAAFTNLTQDHLDVHGSMSSYADAKARLFRDHLSDNGLAVINIDDSYGEQMAAAAGSHRVLRVSSRKGTAEHAAAEIRVESATSTVDGITAVIATPRGELSIESSALLGSYNVDNVALAVGIGEALGLSHEAIVTGLAEMPGVPGRVERVANGRSLDIVVDYAHTPDALRNVLQALRPLTRARLICVFGCGGDRDPGKRPLMGAAVDSHADLAVVTSDNPRTEEPRAIIDMILPAIPKPFLVEPDRRLAIRAAVAEATPGDIVLIAGKGHEDYQIVGSEKIHFDDCEEAAAAANEKTWIDADAVAAVTKGRVIRGGQQRFDRVVIDGRKARPHDLYVAIRGERFDGHDFCDQAIAAGAAGVMVERNSTTDRNIAVIEVKDAREALGAVASEFRLRWAKQDSERRLIGITGSAGKTTTKELLATALSKEGRVLATAGSLNNETGVPLTLLRLRPFHHHAVIEMGMRGLGEIDYLTKIAVPDVGVVVNAGVAHVGVVGSIEAIARGKAEIFAHLPAHGCAVHPIGDERLAALAAQAPRVLTFGEGAGADVRLTRYQPRGTSGVELDIDALGVSHSVLLPMFGRHNALNACCAIAAAIGAGADAAVAISRLVHARPPTMRGEITDIAKRHVIVDCYNSNPAAVEAALQTLGELTPSDAKALAVLGDMLELGDQAVSAHRRAGRSAAERGIGVVALGELAAEVVAGAKQAGGHAELAADPASAAVLIMRQTSPGDWIVVKASRGMKLERVIDAMRELGGS